MNEERFRKGKNKENSPGNVRITSIFKVKKCLFDHQTLKKQSSSMGSFFGKSPSPNAKQNLESSSPEPGLEVLPESPVPSKLFNNSFRNFEDSPFSLFKVKKKRPALQSKVLNCSTEPLCSSITTTPKNSKAKKKELSPQEVCSSLINSCHIQVAVQKSILNPDLIGDFSKPCALPIILGKHPDLKTISPQTMANLLQGSESVKFSLIDCRYPYEFNAGHIQNAQNIYIKEDIVSALLNHSKTEEKTEVKEVIIFYCEFSSERGPRMLRHLRNSDRDMNKNCYPFLYYPELYILEGGYKAFYACFKELCVPQEYKTMLDKDCSEELAFYKNECKSRSRSSKFPKRFRSSVLF